MLPLVPPTIVVVTRLLARERFSRSVDIESVAHMMNIELYSSEKQTFTWSSVLLFTGNHLIYVTKRGHSCVGVFVSLVTTTWLDDVRRSRLREIWANCQFIDEDVIICKSHVGA